MTIIYGGSFNPPTIAHYKIAKYILEYFPNSDFYFLPTNNAYNKEGLDDFLLRYRMLEIVCEKLGNRAKVSDFEGKLDKYFGTYYTLSHFEDPYFIMGADNFKNITKWINYPKIVIDFKFIIIPRENININAIIANDEYLSKYKHNFIILDKFNEIDLSSTEYRKTKNPNLLLEEVNDFINQNNLYKEN